MRRPCRLVDVKIVPWRWLGMAFSIWLWGIDTWPLRSYCSCCRDMILSSHGRSTWCGCLEDVEILKISYPNGPHATRYDTLQGRNYTTWVETAILYIAKRRVMCSKPLHRDPKDTPKFNFRLRGKGCPTNSEWREVKVHGKKWKEKELNENERNMGRNERCKTTWGRNKGLRKKK